MSACPLTDPGEVARMNAILAELRAQLDAAADAGIPDKGAPESLRGFAAAIARRANPMYDVMEWDVRIGCAQAMKALSVLIANGELRLDSDETFGLSLVLGAISSALLFDRDNVVRDALGDLALPRGEG